MDLVDFLGWNTLLLALRWIFIGLIYFALVVVIIAVRREMAFRVENIQPAVTSSPGRLKVVDPGTDPHLRPGALIDLLPVTMLGGGQENDIILEDSFVSGRHARLKWDGFTWWVEDLGSRNGTLIDNKNCIPHSPEALSPGGLLQLGDVVFQLQVYEQGRR